MNRPHWVKASVITDLTGWDGDRLKKARTDGSLKSRTDRGKKVWYDLNSLHPYHLKSKETVVGQIVELIKKQTA